MAHRGEFASQMIDARGTSATIGNHRDPHGNVPRSRNARSNPPAGETNSTNW
jgi:hypothetical protein